VTIFPPPWEGQPLEGSPGAPANGAAANGAAANGASGARAEALRRVAMISLHTSPLDQPGTGDAGGMNVYVLELSKRLAERNLEVEIYTRVTSSQLPPVVETAPGVRVHHVLAGPFEGLVKDELPAQLCVFARHLLRAEAGHEQGWFDLIHSHYWLSGQVGALVRDRWSVPLAHTMHTMAKVKNELLAEGDSPEPAARLLGEEQVVEAADMLIANTDLEAKQLVNLYDADPTRVEVVHPGVDLRVFSPRPQQAARARLGVPTDAIVPMFVGRLQPLKAPDVLLRAVALMLAQDPSLRSRLLVPVVGGPSGSGLEHPEAMGQLASSLGISDVVRFVPPVSRAELVDWYAAATVVCVPSYNESFGLVAIEASAVGTPVVAAAVGGLTTVVRDGVTGLLVEGHDPADYARAIGRVVAAPAYRDRLGLAAAEHARGFAWERTADLTLDVYRKAATAMHSDLSGVLRG
jgi:D-inositol-3-phosphate glycosyltransferase